MTAAVLAPISNLLDKLHLDSKFAAPPGRYDSVREAVTSEEDKRRLIYETDYEPSEKWWAENSAAYRAPENDPLPDGFPEQAEQTSLWDGKVLINQPEKWLYTFTKVDLAVVDAAHKHFESLKLGLKDVSRESFPIPDDSDLFKALANGKKEIETGVGLSVLRGLPVDEWKREKQIAVFAGIAAYIGGRRLKQGTKSIVHLRDITNLSPDERPAITVKGQTSGNQVFHNDGPAGIIGLITLGVAETGGTSQLSSVARTYNELARTRRDIVRELAKGDWKSKAWPEGIPLIFSADGKQVASSYSRRPFFGFYEANPDVPHLSTEKHLALDAVHFTAEKGSLDIDLQKGDLEFFNNLTVFHARNGSEDSEKNQRHLLRLHLDLPEQPLPTETREKFNEANSGDHDDWPLEAWE